MQQDSGLLVVWRYWPSTQPNAWKEKAFQLFWRPWPTVCSAKAEHRSCRLVVTSSPLAEVYTCMDFDYDFVSQHVGRVCSGSSHTPPVSNVTTFLQNFLLFTINGPNHCLEPILSKIWKSLCVYTNDPPIGSLCSKKTWENTPFHQYTFLLSSLFSSAKRVYIRCFQYTCYDIL